MELKTYQDVLNLQQQIMQRIQEDNVDPKLKGSAALDRRRTALTQTQATLAAAETARGEVLKHWDSDLARYRQTIARLQGEITQIEDTLKSAASKAAGTPAASAQAAKPAAAASTASTKKKR